MRSSVPISFRKDSFASLRAYLTIEIISLEWCSAVYRGRKPVPGGVTNVLRGLDKILPSKSTIPMCVYTYLLLSCWRCLQFPEHTLVYLPPSTYYKRIKYCQTRGKICLFGLFFMFVESIEIKEGN